MTGAARLLGAVLVLAAAAIAFGATELPEGEPGVIQVALDALDAGRPQEALELLEAAALVDGPRRFAVWSLLGRTQLRLGLSEEAARSFAQALSRAPGFLPARVGLAESNIARGRFLQAQAALERIAALAAPPVRALELLAGLALDRGEIDAARAHWLRLVEGPEPERRSAGLMLLATEQSPESRGHLLLEVERDLSPAAVYLALGVERQLAGERLAAVELFRIAFEIDEHDPIVRLLLERAQGRPPPPPAAIPGLERTVAEIYTSWEEGRLDEAAAAARAILELRPHHAPLDLLVTRIAEQRGDGWRAFEGYERLVGRVGDLPSITAGAARAALKTGALGAAECRARTALRLRPDDDALLRLLADARARSGARDEAIAILHEAIAHAPSAAANWLRLGDLLFDSMRAGEAIEAYRRALELEPGSVVEIPGFALAALVSEADVAVDTELLARNAERHPESVDALYRVGVARLRAGELTGAERLFQELAAAAPGRSELAYNLAQVYQRQGRPAEAGAQMERFRELKAAEDSEWELHNGAHCRRLVAREHEAAGRVEEALELYEASAAESTADAGDFLAIARLHLAADRALAARAWLDRLLEASPYDRDALELLASVDQILGRTEELERTRRRLEMLDRPCPRPADAPPL